MNLQTTITHPHPHLFDQALAQYVTERQSTPDRCWRAMLFLLTAMPSLWRKVSPYIDMRRGDAYLDRARQEVDLTGSEALMLDLAHNLYNWDVRVDMSALAGTLDDANWHAVLTALQLWRAG